jgi:hypothetical protein
VLGLGPEGLGTLLAAPAIGSLVGVGALVVAGPVRHLGRIAVVAVVRTFLNYFLEKDVQELDRGGRKAAKV